MPEPVSRQCPGWSNDCTDMYCSVIVVFFGPAAIP